MKYVKPGSFTNAQFSIDETITETNDVVSIARSVIEKITDVSDDVKKELRLALTNLDEAIELLGHIRRKSEIALKFVPADVQEKEYL